MNREQLDESPAAIADKAFVFGYPLVLMDLTRQVMTRQAAMNRLVHRRSFPEPSDTDLASPNADTLYSTAWLDVSQEPMVLSVPELANRYYVMQLLDAWTNVFAAPGTRTTGNGPGHFAVVGPGFRDRLPEGVRELRAPTNLVWLIGRTQTNGKDDYDDVRAIQDQYALTPLSAFGGAGPRPTDEVGAERPGSSRTTPTDQVARMDPGEFFYRLNSLMRANPPATVDGGALRRFARIGVGPGKGFDVQARPLSFARELERGVHAGMARILEHVRRPKAKTVNGWQLLTDAGRYGTDYAWRAAVAHVRLGANLPEDAVYPHAWVDATGRPLSGAYRYRIHFRASAFPPVHAFWSITLYDDQQALVPNPIGRYALGDRDRLTFAPDGSLTLFVQNEPPDRGKQPNWLPAPRGGFNLFMRLYWPMAEVLDGTWRPPAVERLE